MLRQMSVLASEVAALCPIRLSGSVGLTKAEKPAQRGPEDEVSGERCYLPPGTVL